MALTRDSILQELARIRLPEGDTLLSRDMIRALSVDGGVVRFVIEAPDADTARKMANIRAAAEEVVSALPGVTSVSVVLTAHAAPAPAPNLKVGRHPKAQAGSLKPEGVKRLIAVGSGKGGVGKSTVSANLAVALARQGLRVGLLDADIYGPSQPRMLGETTRPRSEGETIFPLTAHGVTFMSIGLMVEEGKAVVWRGPMLMGALQQMLGQVAWGALDVLIVDLPPGTGDVQLTLGQKASLDGALIVSTPQDVALIDARKAIDMFQTLKVPILGMIENMSLFRCPECGTEHRIFGQGGVAAEAARLGAPLLADLPIDLDTRLGGDAGTPVAASDGPAAALYADLAEKVKTALQLA